MKKTKITSVLKTATYARLAYAGIITIGLYYMCVQKDINNAALCFSLAWVCDGFASPKVQTYKPWLHLTHVSAMIYCFSLMLVNN